MKINQPNQISNFRWHDAFGNSILHTEWLEWLNNHAGEGFGPVVKYTWCVGNEKYHVEVNRKIFTWELLPDASGFICFESDWKPDNCILLDAYGKERMRLTVPWEMTGAIHPTASQSPTSFDNVSEPYINPETGEEGKFGVTAYIADVFGCKFYFELDYHTGEFLWYKRIRD